MHDWRPAWSVLLGQIVAGAGVCWQGPGVDNIVVEPDLGYKQYSPTYSQKGKAVEVARTQFKKLWEDTLGVCWFACWGVKGVLDNSAQAIALSTGWADFNRDDAMAVGERLVNFQRVIAVSRGFRPEDEFDVSSRLLEAPTVGPAAGKTIATHLKSMVNDYYRFMGWDESTARPTAATLEKVGLAGML
jgi:aldehyde:ferredoxin oxidoreductase